MPAVEQQGDASGQKDLGLEAAGWQHRFETEAIRTGELIDLYQDLGFEVTTRKLAPQAIGPECAGCAIVACQRYVALYTRHPTEQD